MFNFSLSSFMSQAKEKARELQELIEAKVTHVTSTETAEDGKDHATSLVQDTVVVTQPSGYSLVAADPQSATNAQEISQLATPSLPQSNNLQPIDLNTANNEETESKSWWDTFKEKAGNALEEANGKVQKVYEEYKSPNDTQPPSTEDISAKEPGLWNKITIFAGEAADALKEKIHDTREYAGAKAGQAYAQASEYALQSAANAVLWHESKYDELILPEDVAKAMVQIDPEEKLPEQCHRLAEVAAPIVAKALLGDANPTAISGISTYFSKISHKIIACLAAEAFNAKKVQTPNKTSFYEEFEVYGEQEWQAEKDKHRELFEIYHESSFKRSDTPTASTHHSSNMEHHDVFDLASETIFHLVEKHLGTVHALLERIESYARLPEDNDAAKLNKELERRKLLEIIDPILEEILHICHLTSVESLGLSDKLVWAIKKYADYKQHGIIGGIKNWAGFTEDQGVSDWDFIKTTLKEQLFDYYCTRLLEEPQAEIQNLDEAAAKEPSVPDELVDIAQEFLQGVLDRESYKAKQPLSLSADIYKKLRKKVDRKNRLPFFCQRVATAMAAKIIQSKADALAPYCNEKTAAKLQEFLGLYFYKVLHKALAHLATSSAADSISKQDLWLNIAAALVDIANKHYGLIKQFESNNDFSTSLKQALASYDALPEDTEEDKRIKHAAYQKLCEGCAPIVDDLLQTCGLTDIEDLQLTGAIGNLLKTAALAGTGEDAWDLVRDTLQWGLLEIVRMGPELESSIDDKHTDMASIARSAAKDGAPEILKAIAAESESIGQSIEKLLEREGWNVVDARSIERIFKALFEGKDPIFSKFQGQLGDFLSPRVYALLNQAVSFTSATNPKAEDHLQVANTLAKIVVNASEVMQRHVQGRHGQLQQAVKDYSMQEPLLRTLYAAKRHFEKIEQRNYVQQLIWDNSKEDISPPEDDQARMARYDVAISNEQIDIRCLRILEAANCTDKIPEIAMAARTLLGEVDDSRDDLEVIKTLLFGPDESRPLGQCLKNCLENHTQVQLICDQILFDNFTELASEVLALTGIDNNQMTQIPGLAEILDPTKNTAIQWLMLKAYYELTAPGQATGYNEKLEEILFGPEEKAVDPLSEIAGANPEDRKIREASKERQKTKKAVEFFDNTCTALAQSIRNKIHKYLQDDAAEIVTKIDSALTEKFSPEAAQLMREGIKELGQTPNPAVKSIFDYTEELLQGALFKLLVKIAKLQLDKSKPVSNEQMMSAILLQVFGAMDTHKETIALQMDEWHKLPNSSAEDKEVRQKALRMIFKDVSQDLLHVLGEDLLKDMVPPGMKKSLEKTLREKILPDLFGEMYCETTAFEREKKINQERLQLIFTNPDDPRKGSTVPQQAMSAIAQFAAQAGRSYLALNSEETAGTVLDKLTHHLSESGPAGEKAAAYLMAHAKQIENLLSNNMNALAKEQLESTWTSVEAFVESILLQAFGNVSGEIDLLENGKSELLQKITLHLLQLAATHVTRLDKVRKEHGKDYIYEVSSIDLLKGSAKHAGVHSDNPAFEKQYLVAKEELYNAEVKLQELKDNKLSLQKQLRDNLGGILGARFRKNINAKIKAIKHNLKPAYAKVKEAQKKFDDVRKKACFLPIAQDLLTLMNFNSADDLPFPNIAKDQLWTLLQQEILPAALQSAFDNLLDKSVLDSMLINALQAIDTAMADQSTGKKEDTVRTPEQVNYDTQLGQAVVDMIAKMPSVLIKFFMNIEDINKAAVDVIGQKMRAILSEQTIIKLLHAGLFNGMENFVPHGRWETNADGQQVLMQNDSLKIDFKLPMTHDEKKAADKIKEAEGDANAARVHQMIGRTVKTQGSKWIASKIKEGWDNFQDAFDRSIEKNCGGVDGWGMQIKRFFDMLFRAIFVQFIGTILYYVFWPLIKVAELIVDAICENLGMRFQKSVHSGITDSLGFDLSKGIFKKLTGLKKEREDGPQSILNSSWVKIIGDPNKRVHDVKAAKPNKPATHGAASAA